MVELTLPRGPASPSVLAAGSWAGAALQAAASSVGPAEAAHLTHHSAVCAEWHACIKLLAWRVPDGAPMACRIQYDTGDFEELELEEIINDEQMYLLD